MPAASLENGFMVGPMRVDPGTRTVSGPAGTHELTPRQLSVLRHLARFAGSPVSRVDLLAGSFGPGGSDAALDTVIHALRVALDDLAHPSLLITIPRNGYLLRDVRALDAAQVAPQVTAQVTAQVAPPPASVGGDKDGWLRELFERLGKFQQRRPTRVLLALSLSGAVFSGVLAIVNDLIGLFGLPLWLARLIVLSAAAGVPLLTALAWEYRLGPNGVERDVEVAPGQPIPSAWRTLAPALVASAGIAVIGWQYVLRNGSPTPIELGADLILVKPFRSLDPTAMPPGLAEGIADDITHVLTLHGLRVVSYTVLSEEQLEKSPMEIGKIAGVSQVVDGNVRRDGDVTVINTKLIDAKNGETRYTSRVDDRDAKLVDLAMQIGRQIVVALDRELVPEVEASFRLARTDRDDAYVLYYQALAETRDAGDLSRILQAEELLRKALAIDPEFAAAHAELCRLNLWKYERDRDPASLQRAEKYCEVARRLDPLPETAKAIANSYTASGEFAKAEMLFRSLLQKTPDDAELLVGLADALEGQQRWADAEASLHSAVEAEPDRWLSRNALGRFLWQRRRIDEAALAFEDALRIAPNSATTLNNLGSMWLYEGNFGEAAEAFERSLAIEPSKPAFSNLGTVRFYHGDFVGAEAMSREAVKLAGSDYQTRVNLAEALWYVPGRRSEALAEYRVAAELLQAELELRPGRADRQALLGLVRSRLGETAESDRRIAEALRIDANHPDVQAYVAIIAADRKDWAAALTALQRAVELGYPPALIRSAPDFRPLHGKPEFRRLTGNVALR